MKKSAVRTRQRASSSELTVPSPLPPNDLRLATNYVPPDQLLPPERILRKHNARQIKMIRASITEHGFINPILVSTDYRVVSGYGRLLAAKALGMSLVPVLELRHMTPEQLRIYAIADNRIAEQSEFDFDELKLELAGLESLDLDLNIELTGFSTSEIDDLLAIKVSPDEDEENEADDDQIATTAITRPGDHWQLGDHGLVCGNSLDPEVFQQLLGDEKAGTVFSDAPYNVAASSISGMGKHKHRDFAMAAGEMSVVEFTGFLASSFRLAVKYSVDGSIHFQCMDWKHMGEMLAAGRQEYTELKNLIVWAKPAAGMGSCYRSQHELVFMWKNGTAPHVNNFGLGETGRYRSNVWNYKGNSGFHRDRDAELASHPTVKPWSLVADAIRDCSKRGSIILDPFGGSGTTLIAAERTRRKARLIELDPLYCDVAIRRWQKLTGRDAILVGTGQTFSAVWAERDTTSGETDGRPSGSVIADGDATDDGDEA